VPQSVQVGANYPPLASELIGGTHQSVVYNQCNARPMVIYSISAHSTCYYLVTEAHM